MNPCEWIVCERSGRWAAALRIAIARENPPVTASIHEVRSLPELTSRLDVQLHSLALIEVERDQVESVLLWLAAASRRFANARFAAALGYTLTAGELAPPSSTDDRQTIDDALMEAGAAEIVHSSRRLHALLVLGRRHASFSAALSQSLQQGKPSVATAAWASLPWQDR